MPQQTSNTLPRPPPRPQPPSPYPIKTICIALLALIILIAIIILIIWLALRPKKLVYSIDEASITDFNLSNDHLDSTFNMLVRVYNRNKRVSVYHDSMEVAVSYGDQTVAYQEESPFFQHHKNVTRLRVNPTSRHVALPAKTARDLGTERKNGVVDVDVRMKARIRYKVGIFKSRHYKVRVFCSPVLINFSSPDKFTPKDCEVNIKA